MHAPLACCMWQRQSAVEADLRRARTRSTRAAKQRPLRTKGDRRSHPAPHHDNHALTMVTIE
eukprot:scaffold194151_cov31-Tisochrysis_lutea.AAC.1